MTMTSVCRIPLGLPVNDEKQVGQVFGVGPFGLRFRLRTFWGTLIFWRLFR